MKSSDCRGLLASASLLRLLRRLFPRARINVVISVSNLYTKVHKSQFEQKLKNVAVVIVVVVIVVAVVITGTTL